MSRRKARELALQTLFQLDYNSTETEQALAVVLEESGEVTDSTRNYAQSIIQGTRQHLSEVDKIISDVSIEWKLDRMAGVDRNIARIAVYEMNFGNEDLPPNVVINEAVELAKLYGTDESSRFINGILGSLVKNRVKT